MSRPVRLERVTTRRVLFLGSGLTQTHRAHIPQKHDIHGTAELVLYAVRRGVIS